MTIRIFSLALIASFIGAAPARHAIAAQAKSKILWDLWYVVVFIDPAIRKKFIVFYFNEKVEDAGDRIKVQVNTWKKEGPTVAEEHVGEVLRNNSQLSPVLYNFNATSGPESVTIDAKISAAGKAYVAKLRARDHGGKTTELERKLPEGTILSYAFSAWLGKNLSALLDQKVVVGFVTFQEDNLQDGFPVVTGKIRVDKPDEYSKSNNLIRLQLDYSGPITWWVRPSGEVWRIVAPSRNMEVLRVTESEARKSFQ
jgi:hypothetical protein